MSLFLLDNLSMGKKSRQQLGSKVAKVINRINCAAHFRPIVSVCLQNLKLGCQLCSFSTQMSIQNALTNPIQIVLAYVGIDKSFSLTTIKQLRIKDQYNKIKIGFEAILSQIKDKVNTMCSQILQEFNSNWQTKLGILQREVQEIKRAQEHYKKTFEQLLEVSLDEGSVLQIQEVLYQFCNKCSDDPTDYIKTKIEGIISKYQLIPVIDWDSIKSIYSTIIDSNLWSRLKLNYTSIKDYITRKEIIPNLKEQMNKLNLLLSNQINELKNSQFKIDYNDECVKLYGRQSQGWAIISQLHQNYDQMYEFERNRLVGINYEGTSLLTYSFGSLKLIENYPIKACSNLLMFPECFIAEAEGRIIRVWMADKFKQVVSLAGSNLTYSDCSYLFQFTNGKGQVLTRPVYHAQI